MKNQLILSVMIGINATSFAQDVQTPAQDAIRNNFQLEGTVRMDAAIHRSSSAYGDYEYGTMCIGIQMSNTYYFHKTDNFGTGLAIHWIRTEFGTTLGDFYSGTLIISPMQLGWANCWKLDDGRAFEVNLNGGYKMEADYDRVMHGFEISPEVKWRSEKTVFGLGYVYSNYVSLSSVISSQLQMHGLRFTVGIVK